MPDPVLVATGLSTMLRGMAAMGAGAPDAEHDTESDFGFSKIGHVDPSKEPELVSYDPLHARTLADGIDQAIQARDSSVLSAIEAVAPDIIAMLNPLELLGPLAKIPQLAAKLAGIGVKLS